MPVASRPAPLLVTPVLYRRQNPPDAEAEQDPTVCRIQGCTTVLSNEKAYYRSAPGSGSRNSLPWVQT